MSSLPRAVTYRYEAELPYPIEQAYAWLTDYQDDDPSLTTAVVRKRRVVKRTPEEVVLDGEIENLGHTWTGRATIALHPQEHRWVATLREGRMVNEYWLTPTPRGCLLRVDYHVYARRWTNRLKLRLARGRVRRELDAMWGGFLGAMERELARVPSPTPEAH